MSYVLTMDFLLVARAFAEGRQFQPCRLLTHEKRHLSKRQEMGGQVERSKRFHVIRRVLKSGDQEGELYNQLRSSKISPVHSCIKLIMKVPSQLIKFQVGIVNERIGRDIGLEIIDRT
jgi:hypothetical protein